LGNVVKYNPVGDTLQHLCVIVRVNSIRDVANCIVLCFRFIGSNIVDRTQQMEHTI